MYSKLFFMEVFPSEWVKDNWFIMTVYTDELSSSWIFLEIEDKINVRRKF